MHPCSECSEIRETLARVDENVKTIREQINIIVPVVADHETKLQLIYNDKKWMKFIAGAVASVVSTLIVVLSRMLK